MKSRIVNKIEKIEKNKKKINILPGPRGDPLDARDLGLELVQQPVEVVAERAGRAELQDGHPLVQALCVCESA